MHSFFYKVLDNHQLNLHFSKYSCKFLTLIYFKKYEHEKSGPHQSNFR